jgi:hypothetical protein
MPNEWKKSLDSYRYPVNLKDYIDSDQYPDFFKFPIPTGDRSETISFENHFRELARTSIEVWIEVIFWKMYSQTGRRDNKTKQVADHFKEHDVAPYVLFEACNNYIEKDTKTNLDSIRRLLGFSSTAIAIAATFPAFLRPDLFPMVDTRVAKWVGINLQAHNDGNLKVPQLVRPRYLDTTATVLTLSDYDFIHSWNRWCRHKANQLTEFTSIEWRPRDVEMAIFNAWVTEGNDIRLFSWRC